MSIKRVFLLLCLSLSIMSSVALVGCVSNSSMSVSVPQFSPDGKNLILGIEAGQNSGIYNIKLEDMSFHRLIVTPFNKMSFFHDIGDVNPAYSPDGSKVIFSRFQGHAHLFLMDADGKNLIQITTGDHLDLLPLFSRDGKKIYFIREGDHRHSLFSISLNDLSVQEITNFEYYSGRISVSSDGKSLLVSAGKFGERNKPNSLDLTVVNISGQVSKIALHPTINQFSPANTISDNSAIRDAAYLPDGQVIFSAFLSLKDLNGNRMNDSFHSIYIYNQSTDQVKKLLETDSHFGGGPSVSLDGKKISFCTGSPYSCNRVYIANTDGSDLKEIKIKLN